MIIRYPKSVKSNSTIGVTAISSSANVFKVEAAEKNLQCLGYNIKESKNVRTTYKLVSSSGEERAKQFIELWKDEKISHIIAARGGEFSMEMIPYLHEYKDIIKELSPKWMQGYSDTSLINFYLTTNYNIATIHSQNLGDYAMKKLHKSLLDTISIAKLNENEEYIQNSFDRYAGQENKMDIDSEYNLVYDNEYKSIDNKKEDRFCGRLIGGCIDVIKTIIGTPYDNTKDFCKQFDEGMVWCLENCELSVPDLYRALWQMREAGWFQNVKGFLIGRTLSKQSVGEYTYSDAIYDSIGKLNVPIIYDVDIGHIPPQLTYINGAYCEFEYLNGKGTLVQKFI